jgi:hypothetical protein
MVRGISALGKNGVDERGLEGTNDQRAPLSLARSEKRFDRLHQ